MVFSNGRGLDLNFDHHKGQNYGTLWTNIDVNRGNRVWYTGGAEGRGLDSAALTTVWNVRKRPWFQTLPLPNKDFGAMANFVGECRGGALGTHAGTLVGVSCVYWQYGMDVPYTAGWWVGEWVDG